MLFSPVLGRRQHRHARRHEGPSLHGHYPLPRYYGPFRLPASASPFVMFSAGAAGRVTTSRAAGSPRFLNADLSLRAVPIHPGRPSRCSCLLLPHWCQASSYSGSLAAFNGVTRPNRVHITLRLTGSPNRGFVSRDCSPVRSIGYMSNRLLHGELLSVHEICQAFPGAPEDTEENKLEQKAHCNDSPSRSQGLSGKKQSNN